MRLRNITSHKIIVVLLIKRTIRFVPNAMDHTKDYREPWELEEAGESPTQRVSLWKSKRFRLFAILALILATGRLAIDTERSSYENDIVTIYTMARELHRQPALADIPMTDTLSTVRVLVAGARTGTRGFYELNDIDDIEQVAAASLAGQKSAMQTLLPQRLPGRLKGSDDQLMELEISNAISRFYGREGVSAELAAELLRHRGMNMKQVRAFLTQKMFSQTEKVYKYQIAILDEEQRIRLEMHRFPFGWLSGRIRGTYRSMED